MLTANGKIVADQEATVHVDRLGTETNAVVLDDCPSVLSLGRKCVAEKFGFYWNPYQKPSLVLPSGKSITLDVDHYVPVLPVTGPVTTEGLRETSANPGSSTPLSQDSGCTDGPGETSAESTTKKDKNQDISDDHWLTHTPPDSRCPVCRDAKARRAQCRRVKPQDVMEDDKIPPRFGALLTADHIVLGDEEEHGRKGEKNSLMILDIGTGWISSYPSQYRDTDETFRSLQHNVGWKEQVDRIYTDNAGELIKSIKRLGWRHDLATPHRPQTNGRAERHEGRMGQQSFGT